MIAIKDDRISVVDGMFKATCRCGFILSSKYKHSILNALRKNHCKKCMTAYNVNEDENVFIHNDKWSCRCYTCGKIRSYTRRSHAVNSYKSKSNCKKCNAAIISSNSSVGWALRCYNKYKKSAISRGIEWDISLEYIESIFNEKCALTGWDISTEYGTGKASLDRIDSNIGYINGNVQWVHSMVNMSKNKYNQDDFIRMCISISDNIKKGS